MQTATHHVLALPRLPPPNVPVRRRLLLGFSALVRHRAAEAREKQKRLDRASHVCPDRPAIGPGASDNPCASLRQRIRSPLGHQTVPDVVSDSDAAPGTSRLKLLSTALLNSTLHHQHLSRDPGDHHLPLLTSLTYLQQLLPLHLTPPPLALTIRASITSLGSQPCISRMIFKPDRHHHHVPRNLLLRELASSHGDTASSSSQARQITAHGL